MKGRRNNGYSVLGFAALAGLLLLAGCESARKEPERQWTAIGRSADVMVSTNTATSGLASTQPLSTPRRVSELASQSPFGVYDRALVDAVHQRWYSILDRGSLPSKNGVVVVRFTLHSNGTVSEMQVVRNTLDDQAATISMKAIRDCAPFPPWPPEMRRMAGDTRVITFSFDYLK